MDRIDIYNDVVNKIEVLKSVNNLFADTVAKLTVKYEELGRIELAKDCAKSYYRLKHDLDFLDDVDVASFDDDSMMSLSNLLSMSLVRLTNLAIKMLAEAKEFGVA